MDERTVDARGMLCPKPLMLVKQALDEVEPGSRLVILLDNDVACANVTRLLRDQGGEPETRQEGAVFRLEAVKAAEAPQTPEPEAYCEPAPGSVPAGPLVMVFREDTMGRGSDELGRLLIQACINTLPDMNPKPDVLVFYNSGVRLVLEGAPTLGSLEKLADQGVRVLVCGTCIQYFEVKEQVRVGIISNMYEILDVLCGASRIVYP